MQPTRIFNLDGIDVYLTGADIVPNPAFVGTLLHTRRGIGNAVYATWHATPTPIGFAIRLSTIAGRAYLSEQSTTYNLGLEIATLARNVL